MDVDTKLNLVVVDLSNNKKHYYLCIGEYLVDPVVKLVDATRKRFIVIKYNVTVVKIIEPMMDYI